MIFVTAHDSILLVMAVNRFLLLHLVGDFSVYPTLR